MGLTREEIEKLPWIGDQRAQVTALLDRAENAELLLALSTYWVPDFRVKIAAKLCVGTAYHVVPR